ncbi:MAG TPA: DUF2334 domain-containing protein [Thermoanaerobaculia bacterium]|nr:DUF2334 domain-containing protein [Thermoanaerobaculia bacterium]
MLYGSPPFSPPLAPPLGGPYLIVCLDDLTPHNQRAVEEFLPQLAKAGVARVSLLLVPRWQGIESTCDRPYFRRFVSSLAQAGHEICLHGHTHTGAAGEFGDLDRRQADEKLAEGAGLCAQLGVSVAGFMPPRGRLSAEARAALAARGFVYAATASGFDLLTSGWHLAAPVVPLEAESSWQVPAAWIKARVRYRILRGAPVLRLNVQPAALYQPALRATLLTLVRAALLSRIPATCGELAARAEQLITFKNPAQDSEKGVR